MKKNKTPKHYHEMKTSELFRAYLISKLPKGKQKLIRQQEEINSPPKNISINYLAVVLDGVVEDVLRCQNRLAALLLSEPDFVEFDPLKERPIVGLTLYSEGEFSTPKNEDHNLSEEKINNLLKNLEEKE